MTRNRNAVALIVLSVALLGLVISKFLPAQEPEMKSTAAIRRAIEMDKIALEMHKRYKKCRSLSFDNCETIEEKAKSYKPLEEAIKFAQTQNPDIIFVRNSGSTRYGYGRRIVFVNTNATPEEITEFLMGSPPPASGQSNIEKAKTD